MKKLLLFLATMLLSLSVMAWPTRPITIIVPYPPGGVVDKLARIMQKDFQNKVAFPVEIQYMPGAAAAVAVSHVLGRPNDMHTFIIADAGFVVGPALTGTKAYKEFVPVSLIGESPYVMFSSKSSSDQLRQQIKNQIMVNVGIANQGEVWLNDLKWPTQLNLIPYKGATPMMTDAIPGHVEYGILAHLGMMLAADDTQVRPIMVFANKRLSALPNVPTANEIGFNGTYTNNWFALWARQDTNPESTAKMSMLTQQTADANFRETRGFILVNAGLKESSEYVDKEIKLFERLADKIKKQECEQHKQRITVTNCAQNTK